MSYFANFSFILLFLTSHVQIFSVSGNQAPTHLVVAKLKAKLHTRATQETRLQLFACISIMLLLGTERAGLEN
jgi:hypothetical protein